MRLKEKCWSYLGVIPMFLFGVVLHFMYGWSGNQFVVGLLAPVNESIWEHLKLSLIPLIIWWGSYMLINRDVDKNKWLLGLLISIITSMIFIVAFYYTYTGAFGIELSILDISSLFFGLWLGQYLAMHVYKLDIFVKWYISVGVLLLIVSLFIVFTVNAPNLPLFMINNS